MRFCVALGYENRYQRWYIQVYGNQCKYFQNTHLWIRFGNPTVHSKAYKQTNEYNSVPNSTFIACINRMCKHTFKLFHFVAGGEIIQLFCPEDEEKRENLISFHLNDILRRDWILQNIFVFSPEKTRRERLIEMKNLLLWWRVATSCLQNVFSTLHCVFGKLSLFVYGLWFVICKVSSLKRNLCKNSECQRTLMMAVKSRQFSLDEDLVISIQG